MLVIFDAECSLDHYKSDKKTQQLVVQNAQIIHTQKAQPVIASCSAICDTGYQGPDGGPCTGKNTVIFRPFTKHLSLNE